MSIKGSRIRLFLLIAMAGLLSACGTKNITLSIQNIPPAAQTDSGVLSAGVAMTDITAPPGMPMAGHSLMAECGEGVRTRIKARVIYINPGDGKSLALVQCDLLSGSRVIHHRIAELIAGETDIEAGALLLAGTHTHSAPGNMFGNVFYNQFASHKKGFEQEYYEFASRQIADAVIQAYQSARPAKIATGTRQLPGMTRSRSLKPYLKNNGIADQDQAPSNLDAVNPEMVMIRIDCLEADGMFRPVGAFSAFSIHPNVKNGDTDNLYHGDVFAYIEREVEWGIKKKYNPSVEPVHAATNFSHGDNTPNFDDVPLGYPEMERIGLIIGKAAFELFESLDGKLTDTAEVLYRTREVDLYTENSINGIDICPRPVVGMALTGGANDRPTPFLQHIPGFAPGWPRWVFTGGCQAEKRVIGGLFQPLILPKKIFPHNLFMQTIKIDDTVISALPFEVCYEVGNRIQERVKKSELKNVNNSIVVSCANGYFGYVTTPEEYSLQYYEGGHTLYGPNTGEFLAEHLFDLTGKMAESGSGSELPEAWDFPLKKNQFYPKKYTGKGHREIYKGQAPVFKEKKKNREAYWKFQWLDLPPADIELHNPLVRLETSRDGTNWEPFILDGINVDDQGYDVAIICLDEKKKGRGLYEARWYIPEGEISAMKRFTILARKNEKILHSQPF